VVFKDASIALDGRDVTDAIRAETVSAAASRVAALEPVRQALLDRQRAFRKPPGLVADGRDMGSVVFPDAALKIFLTAAPEERARRRYNQLMAKGMSASMSALLQEIRERDVRDSQRSAAPLLKCSDAIELDTTDMTVDEAVAQVLARFNNKRASTAP
jgi:cytidylate kinase